MFHEWRLIHETKHNYEKKFVQINTLQSTLYIILGDVQHNEQWLYIIILTDTSMR